MGRFNWVILAVVGGSLAVTVVAVLGIVDEPPSRQEEFLIDIRAEDLNLGTVWVQENVEHILHVTNRSRENFESVRLKASCGCTQISPETLRLAAGEEAAVTLTLNLTSAALAKKPRYLFAVDIVADGRSVTGQAFQNIWVLKGTIPRRLTTLPPLSAEFWQSLG